MDLSVRSETYGAPEDQTWLGSAHGTNEADTVTLDADRFRGAFTDGFVPSGVVLARDATTGLAVPYDPTYDADPAVAGAQPNGADVAIGHLLTTKRLTADSSNIGAALLWHGQVIVDNLPAGHGLDAGAAADLPNIDYVGTVPA